MLGKERVNCCDTTVRRRIERRGGEKERGGRRREGERKREQKKEKRRGSGQQKIERDSRGAISEEARRP